MADGPRRIKSWAGVHRPGPRLAGSYFGASVYLNGILKLATSV